MDDHLPSWQKQEKDESDSDDYGPLIDHVIPTN